MIERKVYEKLEEKYKDVASWAIWSSVGTGSKDGVKSNTGDMNVFNDSDLLDVLHSNFVLIAMNASEHAPRKDSYTGSWRMFHSDDEVQNDYKIRYAFKDTPFWGAYMTDIIKNHPDKNSKQVKKYVMNHPKVLTENIKVLGDELKILGGNPILIALGRDTERWLRKGLKDEYRILYLTHYSHQVSKETLRASTLKLIEEEDL